jgi:hypothetical protein
MATNLVELEAILKLMQTYKFDTFEGEDFKITKSKHEFPIRKVILDEQQFLEKHLQPAPIETEADFFNSIPINAVDDWAMGVKS